jgi:transposase
MPRTHRPYPPAFRAEAVRLARGSDQSIPALAAGLGVSSEALRHWLRQDAADAGRGQPGDLTTDEREELRLSWPFTPSSVSSWQSAHGSAKTCPRME